MNQLKQLVTKSVLGAVAAGFLTAGTTVNVQASASCPSNKNCCYWPDGTLAGEFLQGTCCCVFEVSGDVSGAKKFIISGEVKYYKMVSYSCNSVPDEC